MRVSVKDDFNDIEGAAPDQSGMWDKHRCQETCRVQHSHISGPLMICSLRWLRGQLLGFVREEPGDCTHMCHPSAYQFWIYSFYETLKGLPPDARASAQRHLMRPGRR